MDNVQENRNAILKKIAVTAKEAGRDPNGVTLVAVSKQQPMDKIVNMLGTGQRIFGENRVQEAKERWGALKETYPDMRLHLIGHLQTNKVREAVALFDVIETLDRPKLADELAKEMTRQGRFLPCLIEVNTGEEAQKGGVLPSDLPDLLSHARGLGLNVEGLMAIPPANEPPALHFALLKKLAARHGLATVSMGMSGDFEKAIALGATHARVGTALFGVRGG